MSTPSPQKQFTEETWAVFEDDALTHLADIEESILALEEDPSADEEIQKLFRAMHTLKGSSGFLGLVALSSLAHAAEDLVTQVRDGECQLDSPMTDALLGTLDMLRRIINESSNGAVAEHVAFIEPMRVRLTAMLVADLEGAIDGRPVPKTMGQLANYAHDLWPDITEAAVVCARGYQGIPPAVEDSVSLVRSVAESLWLQWCVGRLDAAVQAMSAGQGRALPLLWKLLHRRLEGMKVQGFVIEGIDMEPVGPALEDPHVVKFFLECMADLLSPLVDAAKRHRESSDHLETLLDVNAELRAACVAVASPELEQWVSAVDTVAMDGDRTDEALRGAVEALVEALAGLQDTWKAETGMSPVAAHDIRLWLGNLWEQETQPYRDLMALESEVVEVDETEAAEEASPSTSEERKGFGAANDDPPKKAAAHKTSFVRVDVDKLNHLMTLAGELGVAACGVFQMPVFQNDDIDGLRSGVEKVEGLIRELQDSTGSLGLVPLGTVFSRMGRLIRDLNQQTGKPLTLSISGGDTEIEKVIVDALADPLIHLIRNAADHGVESPEEREAAGKPALSEIKLSARHHGGTVIVVVEDDGAGMDRDAILSHAIKRGVISAEAGETMPDEKVWELVFAPGFSTAKAVSGLSGRGVGMDVVRSTVEAHRGRLSVTTEAGKGTAVHLRLPLSFIDGMVVRVGSCFYIVPIAAVSKVFRVEEGGIESIVATGVDMVRLSEELIPVLPLKSFFEDGHVSRAGQHDYIGRLAVVVQTIKGQLALPIDEFVGHERVTIRPLTGYLRGIRAGSACGLLRSGRVAIALDCERLHDIWIANVAA